MHVRVSRQHNRATVPSTAHAPQARPLPRPPVPSQTVPGGVPVNGSANETSSAASPKEQDDRCDDHDGDDRNPDPDREGTSAAWGQRN